MRILLIGDYSSFHINLKIGLEKLGHNVHLLTNGDGFKKTAKSDSWFPDTSSIFSKIFFLLFHLKKFRNFDVVQLVNENILGFSLNLNYYFIKFLKRNNRILTLSSCGNNYFLYKSRHLFRYNFLDPHIEIDLLGKNPFIEKKYILNNVNVEKIVDAIIPISFTYKVGYSNSRKLKRVIPLPIDIEYLNNKKIKNNKITIFHGLSRPGFKGSHIIKEAFSIIQEKYKDKVDCKIVGSVDLYSYINLLHSADIVVDQVYSYEYGMNALYSLALNKVVLSGNELESQNDFNFSFNPIINILPTTVDIVNKLSFLIDYPLEIERISLLSRKFVEKYHEATKVAGLYLKLWEEIIDEKE